MELLWPQRRRWVLAALLLAYLVTRAIRFATFPPFFDEGYYAAQAHTAYLDPQQAFIALADGKGPLQTWLAMGVQVVHVDPLAAVRVVSLVAGAVTLLAVVGIANRIAGGLAAIAAGAVYVVLPFALVHDPMGLVDPITSACMAVAFYLQVRLAQDPHMRWGALTGIAMGLGLLTKANALFAVVALPLSLLLFDWSREDRGPRLRRWLGSAVLAVVLAFAIEAVERLSGLYSRMDDVAQAIGAYHGVGEGLSHLGKYLSDNSGFAAGLWGYLTLPLILAAIAGIVWLARGGRAGGALLLVAWFAGPVAIGWILATNPYPRYILSALPAFTVLAGVGAAWLLTELHGRRGRLAVAIGVLALASVAIVRDGELLSSPKTSGYAGRDVQQYVTAWPSGNGYGRVARALESIAPPGKVDVVTTDLVPFQLAVALGKPRLIKGTGVAPVASAVEVTHGRTTFRLSPRSDPAVAGARLGVFDRQLMRFLPAGVAQGRPLFVYSRPAGGTTILVVRAAPTA